MSRVLMRCSLPQVRDRCADSTGCLHTSVEGAVPWDCGTARRVRAGRRRLGEGDHRRAPRSHHLRTNAERSRRCGPGCPERVACCAPLPRTNPSEPGGAKGDTDAQRRLTNWDGSRSNPLYGTARNTTAYGGWNPEPLPGAGPASNSGPWRPAGVSRQRSCHAPPAVPRHLASVAVGTDVRSMTLDPDAWRFEPSPRSTSASSCWSVAGATLEMALGGRGPSRCRAGANNLLRAHPPGTLAVWTR